MSRDNAYYQFDKNAPVEEVDVDVDEVGVDVDEVEFILTLIMLLVVSFKIRTIQKKL